MQRLPEDQGLHVDDLHSAAQCTGTIDAGKFTDTLFVACEQPSDCPQGKTCTAVKTTGTSIGVCL